MSRTFTVGMLIPDLTNPLFPPIVRGIEDRLREAGWTLIIANTDNDDVKELSVLDSMTARRVDGLILATARRELPVAGADHGQRECPRCWSTAPPTSRPSLPSSATTTAGSDRQFATWPRSVTPGSRTSAAPGRVHRPREIPQLRLLDAQRGTGRRPHPDHLRALVPGGPGAEAFEELLDSGADFTAVVCGNDLIALGVYQVMRERGLRCPEDVSVVGYNDTLFNDSLWPPLTSVRIPHYQIGFRAADILVDAIDRPGGSPADVRIKPELIVRGSTAPPRP